MKRVRGLASVAVWIGALWMASTGGSCEVIGKNLPAQSLTRARILELPSKQRQAWLAYFNRSVRLRRADKQALAKELRATGTHAPRIPESGWSARSIPLNRASAWYGSADARALAETIVSFQTPAGGWGKNLNMRQGPRLKGEAYVPNNLSRITTADDFDTPREPDWNYVGTIDNDATTTELEFLAKVIAAGADGVTGHLRASFQRGMQYLFEAQYPNGGWPQVWPLEGGYHDAITYNDDAMIEVMELMSHVAGGRGEFSFVSAAMRRRAAESFRRGMDCVLVTQMVSHGQLTVWPQQDDPLTLQPVSGRNFEPAAACAGESSDVLSLMMQTLPDPDAREQRAIRSAADWFRKTAIVGEKWTRTGQGRELVPQPGAAPIWARYYAADSDRPIFSDRNKLIYDQVKDISLERRNGYQWYVQKPAAALEEFKAWSTQHPEGK